MEAPSDSDRQHHLTHLSARQPSKHRYTPLKTSVLDFLLRIHSFVVPSPYSGHLPIAWLSEYIKARTKQLISYTNLLRIFPMSYQSMLQKPFLESGHKQTLFFLLYRLKNNGEYLLCYNLFEKYTYLWMPIN